MSHHLDSPIARQDIRLDITDLYVFRGQTGTVFAIDVCHSIFGPIPTPGFHPEGMYEFKVDLDGDATEDVTYRVTFRDRDPHGNQAYVVRRIGVWAVSTLATDAGGWRSINRIGLPMIHPLFTQFNEDLGNRLNAGRPADDFATYGPAAIRAVCSVVGAYGTASDPKTYAETFAHRLFPNILPYEVGTAAAFGFAGWNGRSLIDNAPDVMFSLAANTPVRLGIGKESVTSKPSPVFPYVPAAG